MLNLVTGVFVEGAQRIAKEEKEQELIKSVQKLCRWALHFVNLATTTIYYITVFE